MIESWQLSQIFHMTWANMKSRYRKTIAGLIWVIINPIIMYGAQSLAIKHFLKLQLPNFYIFLLGGLLPWIFITQTLTMTAPIILSNGGLLKSFKVNPLLLIYSQILDNFINFLLPFGILLAILWGQSTSSSSGLIFLPVAFLIMISGVIAMSKILAILQVFFRDTVFVVNFLTGVMFFLTPVFYPISYVPEKYQFLVSINPFYIFIEPVRSTIYDYNFNHMIISFGKASAVAITLLILGSLFWRAKKNKIYNHV